MLENNGSSHCEGLCESYAITTVHPRISLNRSAVTDPTSRLSGFMDEKLFFFGFLLLSPFLLLSSNFSLPKGFSTEILQSLNPLHDE
jgi:hypothetical protein